MDDTLIDRLVGTTGRAEVEAALELPAFVPLRWQLIRLRRRLVPGREQRV